jgi:tetrahydromethanopterin S-methyltransferase subunit G
MGEESMEEKFVEGDEIKQIYKTLNDLSMKMDHEIEELTKSIENTLGEKQGYAEGKINDNPLAYMAGAFVGGVIVGYVMGRV